MRDRSLSGIFDGNDAVRGLAACDLVKDFGEVELGQIFYRMAELFDGRLMGPSPLWAEVGDLHIVLEGESGGHDLAVNGKDGTLGKTARVHGNEFFQESILALGSIDLEAVPLFHDTDLMHEVGTLREEFKELGVESVDLDADFVESHDEESISGI